MLKIGIADDHQLFRKGLVLLVNNFKDMTVTLEASNGRDLLDNIGNQLVDIILLDIQMPGMDGYQACIVLREKYPNIKVLIISQLTTKEVVHKVMELGAHGFFSKNSNPVQLESAILGIRDKDFYFGDELESVLREAILWEKEKKTMALNQSVVITEREMDVIRLACKEYSSIEIADKLCITVRTVDTHRKRIMERTRSKNFLGVILFALRHGLLYVEDL